MIRRDRSSDRMVALFLLGVLLLMPPLLLIFNHPVRVLGIPILYLYVFVAWACLIALAAIVSERLDRMGEPVAPVSDIPNGRKPGNEVRRRA